MTRGGRLRAGQVRASGSTVGGRRCGATGTSGERAAGSAMGDNGGGGEGPWRAVGSIYGEVEL
jgi:hypothetical protein